MRLMTGGPSGQKLTKIQDGYSGRSIDLSSTSELWSWRCHKAMLDSSPDYSRAVHHQEG
jgi:hypothetical protein